MTRLIRLGIRLYRDGTTFAFFLDYLEEHGQRRRKSLQHADKRRAQRQRDELESKLRIGAAVPGSLKLTGFWHALGAHP